DKQDDDELVGHLDFIGLHQTSQSSSKRLRKVGFSMTEFTTQ
ncbi:14337_t:CDS:2, partial [Ambispora leptoticha]